MIGMGCARKLTFSWGGNPGVGSLHRLRDAVENGWPQPLELDEHSHAGMAAAFCAGAARLPFGMLRGYVGTDLPAHNPHIRRVACPFTGETLAAVPALNPDVTILHAQRADRAGNVAHPRHRRRRARGRAGGEDADRHGRGDRRRAAAGDERASCCRTGSSAPWCPAAAAPIRPMRRATTPATTRSTSAGTRSRASATASSPGWTSTCSAPPDHRAFLASLQQEAA